MCDNILNVYNPFEFKFLSKLYLDLIYIHLELLLTKMK